jgi:multidrug efflux pump subunit AcrB
LLTIQLTQEDLNNSTIRESLTTFIAVLSDNTDMTWESTKPKKKIRNNKPSIKIVIDEEIERKMSDSIKTARSLYFLTLIKRETRISTEGLSLSMRQAFPDFTSKSIGGLTGSISRWCKVRNLNVPFKTSRDQYNTTTIFTWNGFKS